MPKNLETIAKGKHIERKFHLVREIVNRGDVSVEKITSVNNIVDQFTKTLPTWNFELATS